MKVAAVVRDIMLFSRIESAARVAGVEVARVDGPAVLPPDADLILVDWSARDDDWADALRAHPGRVILFGPHTDLEAHAAARDAGLGPMWARSKLLADLPSVMNASER
ncbi:MAG: hypothetical protein M3Y83_05150 [Actinomycetota bacterium]|nr:hypothetical protein [Actinomycetota bacterium]